MTAKPTSGPWQSHDDQTTDGFVTIIANIDGEYVDGSPSYTYDVIARCEDEFGERLPNVAANVKVICALPDLIEALRGVLPKNISLNNKNIGDNTIVPMDFTMGELRQISAALAKAGVE